MYPEAIYLQCGYLLLSSQCLLTLSENSWDELRKLTSSIQTLMLLTFLGWVFLFLGEVFTVKVFFSPTVRNWCGVQKDYFDFTWWSRRPSFLTSHKAGTYSSRLHIVWRISWSCCFYICADFEHYICVFFCGAWGWLLTCAQETSLKNIFLWHGCSFSLAQQNEFIHYMQNKLFSFYYTVSMRWFRHCRTIFSIHSHTRIPHFSILSIYFLLHSVGSANQNKIISIKGCLT